MYEYKTFHLIDVINRFAVLTGDAYVSRNLVDDVIDDALRNGYRWVRETAEMAIFEREVEGPHWIVDLHGRIGFQAPDGTLQYSEGGNQPIEDPVANWVSDTAMRVALKENEQLKREGDG